MIQSELAEQLRQKYPLFKNIMIDCLKVIENKMIDHLAQLGRIEIRGLGSFKLRHHEPHLSRNPKTGEQFITPPKDVVRFKPGKILKERVNRNYKAAAKSKKEKQTGREAD